MGTRGPKPIEKHGTRARYLRHRRDKEEACAECKTANAEYNSKHRNSVGPRDRRAELLKQRIHRRALTRLGELFPVELLALEQEEMRKECATDGEG